VVAVTRIAETSREAEEAGVREAPENGAAPEAGEDDGDDDDGEPGGEPGGGDGSAPR